MSGGTRGPRRGGSGRGGGSRGGRGREGERGGRRGAGAQGASRAPRERAAEGYVFGYQAVRGALEASSNRVERLLLQLGRRDARTSALVGLARERRVPFQQVPASALDRLAAGVRHQGVAARMAACSLVPEAELVGRLPENALALVLDGVSDPRNVGAVARSGAAMGAHGLFLPGWRSAGLSPGAARTAAGALETLPVSRAGNSGRLLDALAERGLALIALDANSGLPPWDVDLAGGLALVAGGEEKGLRRSLMERADAVVRIPVREEVGSLNVSVAVGMVLLECARQRSCATGAENPEGGS